MEKEVVALSSSLETRVVTSSPTGNSALYSELVQAALDPETYIPQTPSLKVRPLLSLEGFPIARMFEIQGMLNPRPEACKWPETLTLRTRLTPLKGNL